MTAEEYLNQAYRLDELIQCRLEEVKTMRELVTSVSAVAFDEKNNTNPNTHASFERTVYKLQQYEKEIQEDMERMINLKKEISDTIYKLDNNLEKSVLLDRYINMHKWEEICVDLGLSRRTALRIKNDALIHLEKFIK